MVTDFVVPDRAFMSSISLSKTLGLHSILHQLLGTLLLVLSTHSWLPVTGRAARGLCLPKPTDLLTAVDNFALFAHRPH